MAEAPSNRGDETLNPVFENPARHNTENTWPSPSPMKHSSSYLSGHSPAGFGGNQTGSSRQHKRSDSRRQRSENLDPSREKRRQLRTWHRREVELGQICMHRNFDHNPERRAEVNGLIDSAVEKLLLANKLGREEEAQHGMSNALLERMVFCDTAINFFNKLLPLNDEAHLPLLRWVSSWWHMSPRNG